MMNTVLKSLFLAFFFARQKRSTFKNSDYQNGHKLSMSKTGTNTDQFILITLLISSHEKHQCVLRDGTWSVCIGFNELT